MSYTEDDYAADQYYLEISKELYPELKAQAIAEFTRESLFFYTSQIPSSCVRPVFQEGVTLDAGHNAACFSSRPSSCF